MTAVTACRTCGTEPLENARFCHGCGSPVAAADTHAEYKQVTVLFADVVHSMSIAAVVGTERLREIFESGGAEVTVHWSNVGHGLVPEDLDAAAARPYRRSYLPANRPHDGTVHDW